MREYSEYWEEENKRMEQAVLELKSELSYDEWIEGQCKRLIFLYDRMSEIKLMVSEYASKYAQSISADKPYLERHGLSIRVKELQADYQKMSRKFDQIIGADAMRGNGGKITDEMVRRAREYPIEQLVEVNKKGFALCVNHIDTKPSMFCRKNYAYCFSCGYKGDVLDVAMKVRGASFVEVVRDLSV